MAGAGAVGEKQVLRAEGLAGQNLAGKKCTVSRPRAIQTGLKCDIVLAGSAFCLEKIEGKKCPFASCVLIVNQRCSTVHEKVMLL
ncbi:MAG: hypothetical protein ACKUBY_01080 [Candidatus Moraniibacteriota bacterium]|jgi:hypothetical protein